MNRYCVPLYLVDARLFDHFVQGATQGVSMSTYTVMVFLTRPVRTMKLLMESANHSVSAKTVLRTNRLITKIAHDL